MSRALVEAKRAVAVAMAEGPGPGLVILDMLGADALPGVVPIQEPVAGNGGEPLRALLAGGEPEAADRALPPVLVAVEEVDGDRLTIVHGSTHAG